MDNVLNEIIKIENDAKKIIDEAQTAKRDLDDYIAREAEKIEEEYKNKNEKLLSEEKDKLIKEMDSELSKLEKAHSQKLEEFNNDTVSKSKKWSEEIFKKLISDE